MSNDVTLTLPGDIPGLLRRGSHVLAVWGEEAIEDGEYSASGVVLSTRDVGGVLVAHCGWDDGDADQSAAIDTLHLDLSDVTSRAHAAWWLHDRWTAMLPPGWIGYVDGDLGPGHYEASIKAAHGQQMVEAEISKLHRTCLHFAAVAPL